MVRMGKLLLASILATSLLWAVSCGPRNCCSRPGCRRAGGKCGIRLCAKCGQVKGTAVCCKAGAKKCGKCSLAKGSPGCCKITKGATEPVLLCGKCGQIKGTDACCKADAKKCGKCGLAKGSPGCCKIKKSQ